MICRAAAREARLMIPPSSPVFLAERQSIFTPRETQSQLENIKHRRVYIACGHLLLAWGARPFSSPAVPRAAEGQPKLRCGSLIKTELCLYQEKKGLCFNPFLPNVRSDRRGRMSSGWAGGTHPAGCCHPWRERGRASAGDPATCITQAPTSSPRPPPPYSLRAPASAAIQGSTARDHRPCRVP